MAVPLCLCKLVIYCLDRALDSTFVAFSVSIEHVVDTNVGSTVEIVSANAALAVNSALVVWSQLLL